MNEQNALFFSSLGSVVPWYSSTVYVRIKQFCFARRHALPPPPSPNHGVHSPHSRDCANTTARCGSHPAIPHELGAPRKPAGVAQGRGGLSSSVRTQALCSRSAGTVCWSRTTRRHDTLPQGRRPLFQSKVRSARFSKKGRRARAASHVRGPCTFSHARRGDLFGGAISALVLARNSDCVRICGWCG